MRDEDRARILHMIEAAEAMAQFVAGRSREELDHNRMLLFALVHAIEVFGEAASRVSPEARAAAPEIPWSAIVSMRNRLIHGYFDTDTTVVWKTATMEVPALTTLLRTLAAPES
jgi:uncharacterized protein with HEPN domain